MQRNVVAGVRCEQDPVYYLCSYFNMQNLFFDKSKTKNYEICLQEGFTVQSSFSGAPVVLNNLQKGLLFKVASVRHL